MRNFSISIFLLLITVGYFSSCEETALDGRIILEPVPEARETNYVKIDTLSQLEVQSKRVLVEDFTGVQCVNCPKAAVQAKEISNKYPGRATVMAIHAGPPIFVNPADGKSKYDFRTETGTRLFELMGGTSNPIGAVDRVLFNGNETVVHSPLQWLSSADLRITESSPVNIGIEMRDLNPDSLEFEVKVVYKETVADSHFLSVYITEDSIIDYQKDIDLGDIKDYRHDHVFRAKATNLVQGDPLNATLVAGRVFKRIFTVPIQKEDPDSKYIMAWKYNKLNVVAVVHKRGTREMEVIQVADIHAE